MIEIFEREKIDGLEELISSSHSLSYALDMVESPPESTESTLSLLNRAIAENIALASEEQPDLHYIDSILATLGWNLNDDIFLRDEVVKAKNTPVDKPFNRMHNQDEIIGHMTSSRLLDTDYNLSNDESFEHIAVNSVIYKAWRDKEKKEEILKTIAEIKEGKWKVSMECLFSKFDYGIITADGKQIIVERTPETSYLTKHLRAYGGTGYYQKDKVGRVLRNITFCGKGLVDNPGNPYSIIFNSNKKFFGATASYNESKENVMTELEKAEFEKAKADLLVAQNALAEFKLSSVQEVEKKLNQAIAERDGKITALQSDLTSTMARLATADEKVVAVEAAKVELVLNLEKTVAELTAIKTAQTLASRKTALADVVGQDRVEALMAKIGGLSDEAFATFVETLAGMPPWLDKGKDKEDKKDKKDEKKEEANKDCAADFSKASLNEKEIPLNLSTEASKKAKEDFNSMVNTIRNGLTKQKTVKMGDK